MSVIDSILSFCTGGFGLAAAVLQFATASKKLDKNQKGQKTRKSGTARNRKPRS